ncbi:hypothetical protein [Nitrococcus mobilis]|uniref:Uncharacterized protein n=1 Tax=Nitrococcus mobilis Nb-231 TaxID=314278 RepID=A4BTL5_9GAMM|nr:hypothetical protein [Nitrococcus mobilis]EAR20971.1 hypothetical protein NB231_00260 [Nitrococcus mobilis Nb-231]
MPIVERDPWRMQYFEGVACPDEVLIPTEDSDAWQLYPQHRWIYSKLLICESQGLAVAPHGVSPPTYPVFSKPIYNLRGMGSGISVIHSADEYERLQTPGHMWMPLLSGEHVSTDVAVVDGEPQWWRHTVGKSLDAGVFDYWTVLAEHRPELEAYCGQWLRHNLKGYSGFLNLETIGGRIIEAHLRFADQWPDLYGPGWLEAVVELYVHGRWQYADTARRDGYSVVLFGGHGPQYEPTDPRSIDKLAHEPGVSSIQVTFHVDKPAELHAMPPGGFRLAIVNCWDLGRGLWVRDRLALLFWTGQPLGPRLDGRISPTQNT